VCSQNTFYGRLFGSWLDVYLKLDELYSRYDTEKKPPRYGFVKVNKDALVPRIKEWRARNSDSKDDMSRYKFYEFISDLYKIYDVRGFIKEMKEEGRPVPSDDSNIVDVFESDKVALMSESDLESAFRTCTSRADDYYFWKSVVV